MIVDFNYIAIPLLVFAVMFIVFTFCYFRSLRVVKRGEKQMSFDVEDGFGRFVYPLGGGMGFVDNTTGDGHEIFQAEAIEDWNRVGKHFGKKWNAKKLRDQKHIVLFLGADSDPKQTIHVDVDCDAIKSALDGSDIFHVIERYDVKKTDIVPLITQFKPSIIHFDGHGTSGGEIAVCSDARKFDLIAPEELRCLFNAVKSYVKLCYFDVCHTLSHAQQAVLSVDAAIGMEGEWSVEAARVFSRQFYHALENEHSISQSFELARSQLVMSDHKECSSIPKLELSVGVGAGDRCFTVKTNKRG